MLTKQQVVENQKWLKKNSTHIKTQSSLCNILSDPTRIKILLLIKHYNELCVSDIASILEISISAISHQLSLMEKSGVVTYHKMGKLVCYHLAMENKDVIKILNTHLDRHIH